MKQYTIIRTKTCDFPAFYSSMIYDDINMAHTICKEYLNWYCAHNCGCQFRVEEVEEVEDIHIDLTTPLSINWPNDYWTSPATYELRFEPLTQNWNTNITTGTGNSNKK